MARPTIPPAVSSSIERLAKEVSAHPSRDALGALAWDVLSRQAEGRVLFAGREFAEKRAAEHGVTRENASSSAGNVLAILERGAETDPERSVVAALAVHGLGMRLAAADADETTQLLARFVRVTDWLEIATHYTVLPFVDAILEREIAAKVWSEIAQAIVDDAGAGSGATPRERARSAARLTALSASGAEAAKRGLAAVAGSTGIDGATRALAASLGGTGPAASTSVRGRALPARRGSFVRVLGWITGLALIAWAVRGVAALLGTRREAELSLGDGGLELCERRFLLGRMVKETRARIALSSLVTAERELRHRSLHLLVGTFALGLGILLGGTWIVDGARSGELSLLMAGAVLLLGGAGLDLAIDVLVPVTRGKVALSLATTRGGDVRVGGLSIEEADGFLDALRAKAS